jgi:hypothetical protein
VIATSEEIKYINLSVRVWGGNVSNIGVGPAFNLYTVEPDPRLLHVPTPPKTHPPTCARQADSHDCPAAHTRVRPPSNTCPHDSKHPLR